MDGKNAYRKTCSADGIPVRSTGPNAFVIISDCSGDTQTLCFSLDADESEDQVDFYSDARGSSSVLWVTRYNIPAANIHESSRLGFYEVECWDKEMLDRAERFANDRELQDWLRSFFYKHAAYIISDHASENA